MSAKLLCIPEKASLIHIWTARTRVYKQGIPLLKCVSERQECSLHVKVSTRQFDSHYFGCVYSAGDNIFLSSAIARVIIIKLIQYLLYSCRMDSREKLTIFRTSDWYPLQPDVPSSMREPSEGVKYVQQGLSKQSYQPRDVGISRAAPRTWTAYS